VRRRPDDVRERSRSPLVVKIDFTWRGRAKLVEVAGDFPDFRRPHALREIEPDHFHTALDLEPGVYRYKFLVDGNWSLDPRNSIIDASEGVDNNTLVVGGAQPPLYFAPDRRHLGVVDGRVVIRFETDDVDAPAVVVDDRAIEVREVLRRGRRRFFFGATEHGSEMKLASRGRDPAVLVGGVSYAVPRDAPRNMPRNMPHNKPRNMRRDVPREVQRDTPRDVPLDVPLDDGVDARSLIESSSASTWLDGAVIYGIFLDRWRRGRDSPPERKMLAPTTPSTPHTFYGGDLDGVRESLDYLANLGVTAIALSPLHVSESPHRYDARDDLSIVDERVGGERALRALIDAAHARDLRVIVDVSLTHVHERHPAFQDLLANQSSSQFASWFPVRKFPVVARDRSTVDLYYNCSDQPWLDLDDAGARRHALDCVLAYVDRGVDGVRLDAMDNAPASFWAQLRREVRAHECGLDVVLLGEVVHDALWTVAEDRGVDVVTDFRIRDAFVAFFANRTLDARGFVDALAFARNRAGAFPDRYRLAFLDNHDTARFLSLAKSEARLRCALATLLFLDETAWITYGTEAHLAAFTGERVLDSSWPERKAMPDPSTLHGATLDLLRSLCAIRKRTRGARVDVVEADGPRLVLRRADVELTVDTAQETVALSSSTQ
jgi:glycosidase